MVSDASPRPNIPKMDELFVHTMETFSNREYAEDGYLKRHHLTIIGGDIRSDNGWFWGGLGVVRHLALDYLGKAR